MVIDIDKLTEAELVDLNHRIVERLRLLQHIRAHADMLEFSIGERVTFQPDGRGPVQGMLTRYNRKSVTVVTDDGHRWTVSPALLSRATVTGQGTAPGYGKAAGRIECDLTQIGERPLSPRQEAPINIPRPR